MPQFLSDKFKGALALFGSALIYAFFGLLVREMAKMYGNYSQVATRFILVFVFVFIFNRLRHKELKFVTRDFVRASLLGCAFMFSVIFFTLSVTNTKIANTVFLLYAASMITSFIIGTAVFKEKFTVQKVGALILSFAGLFMYSDAVFALSAGIITGISAGVFDSFSNILRKSLKAVDRAKVLQYQFFGGGLGALIIMFFVNEPIFKEITILPIFATLIFALLQVQLNNWLLYGFQNFDVNVGTVILAVELFFASLIGFIFFQETLSLEELIGGVLIFTASILAVIKFKFRFNS